MHRSLAISLEPGLSTYLEDKVGIEGLVQTAPPPQTIAAVTAGLTPEQPTDLLSSPRFKELLETWKKEYQYILIDSPPLLVAADAAVLSTLVEGVLFVLRAERSHREAALVGKQRLIDVGAKIIGGILNGARLEMERGYRHYYYYRSYRSGNRYGKRFGGISSPSAEAQGPVESGPSAPEAAAAD